LGLGRKYKRYVRLFEQRGAETVLKRETLMGGDIVQKTRHPDSGMYSAKLSNYREL